MPGIYVSNFDNANKVELINYADNRCCKDEMNLEKVCIKRNVLNSFMNDKAFAEDDNIAIATDGIIYNSQDLINQYQVRNIQEVICIMAQKSEKFFEKFQGHFSGIVYYKEKNKLVAYTNQLGDRSIFYYFDKKTGKYIIGSQLNYIVDTLKMNNIEYALDQEAVDMFLDFGFFIDDSTFIEGIKRLYPGNYLVIENGDCIIKEYYLADYDKEYIEPSIAIEKLDTAFNNAMLRIANKNKEYGYKNVLDISGGLDSRIICYAAKRLEIDNSILITYSQSDSHEDKITKRIANDLGFDLYYKTLDNGKCLKEIDKLVFMNNGTAYYHGITGGGDFLEVLSNQSLGMEYTGLLGNMYDNSMITEYGDKEPIVNYPKFIGSKINKINDKYNNNKILKKFSNNDLFWLYTRGMLAGMSTFLTRQNFLEPVAPFGDIEFLEVFLKIPWEERMEENILRRWFIEKYPNAAQIPYATTGYSILKENNKFHKYRVLLKLYMSKALTMIQRKPLPHNMNPINYWLMKDPSINEYIKKYYELEIDNINVDDHLINKMKKMYNESEDYIDKSIVLTVLSFSKQFVK